jgi:DNA-3-methyladenine glycosylase
VSAGERRRPLPREFYAGDALEVAPRLLNKLVVRGRRVGRIVEVEAYGGADDPASHAYRGPTRRNATMFGPPGRLYVYFTYGMHWCANVVCGPEGVAQAVLVRALAPVGGVEEMRTARLAHRGGRPDRLLGDRHLASGPARLCQALGITGEDDGADLVGGDRRVQVVDDGVAPPLRPGRSGRVGLSSAAERPWRFFLAGDPHVSRGPAPRVAGAPSSGGRGGGGVAGSCDPR